MKKNLFIESIKVKDGVLYNQELHQKRANQTAKALFNTTIDLGLAQLHIPSYALRGLYKCRIVYADRVNKIEFLPYCKRVIKTCALVRNNQIDYRYKSANRELFKQLLKQTQTDEILLVKDGFITDSSFSNLVFENEEGFFTPSTYLLKGVKREELLQRGVIHSREIREENLAEYHTVYFINAMNDLTDGLSFPLAKLVRENSYESDQ